MSIDKIFEALSSAPRRRILAYLSKTDMTAGEIAQRFADVMSQPAISKHLSVLENAGLVWREKRGQNMHYGLKEDILTHALCRFPRGSLSALPAVPEGKRCGSEKEGEARRHGAVKAAGSQHPHAACGAEVPSQRPGAVPLYRRPWRKLVAGYRRQLPRRDSQILCSQHRNELCVQFATIHGL